ncbi:putative non-heme bromoperoxidase BpoC [Enhygromyxa salina]|uniref:Putative non-heme bromoperoxidase BpoC n=1 Tax=Enhygromyxa salina TaxID=215803 RepID=A0A2S9XUS8_9BACT|nr:putative non-heme bromoperoxidase BpoC [Enhygromyxa salina]
MPHARVGEVSLHYERAGSWGRDPHAPVVVFVNGLLTELGSWAAHLPHFAHYRCLMWDCRGQGLSDKPAVSEYTVADHARDLAGLLDLLELRDPVALVGLSNGAATALSFAAAQPERVRALVVSGAYARVDRALELKLRSWIQAMHAGGGGLRFDVATPWVFGPQFLAENWASLALFRERAMSLDLGAAQRLIAGALLHHLDDAQLGRIRAATLVNVGEDDVLTPPSMARTLAAAIPGARLELLAEAGHAGALERVEAFCDQALGFLDPIMHAQA